MNISHDGQVFNLLSCCGCASSSGARFSRSRSTLSALLRPATVSPPPCLGPLQHNSPAQVERCTLECELLPSLFFSSDDFSYEPLSFHFPLQTAFMPRSVGSMGWLSSISSVRCGRMASFVANAAKYTHNFHYIQLHHKIFNRHSAQPSGLDRIE